MLNVPIAVKKALKEGTHKKNYRFVVLNDDGTADFTIDNDTLVAESVMIDERMATGSELKFGLCEGSSLEFQYFDHDNIRGRQLQVFIDVEYGEEEPYAIPMGFFTVKSCSMQFSTGIFKATCYNKLMSDYLDAKANDILLNSYETTSNVLLADISRLLLDDYQIKNDIEPASRYPGTVDFRGNTALYPFPFYFTSLYGIESPISAAGYNQFDTPSLSQPFYIGIEGAASTYLLDETNKYWIIKELAGKLSDLEQHTIDRIKYLIDSAQITTTSTTPPFTGGAVTGDMFVAYLM